MWPIVCAQVPPMEAAPLASFTTSPSCSSSQSAVYCPPPLHLFLPYSYLSSHPLLQPHPFLSLHTNFSIISVAAVSFPPPFLGFQLSLVWLIPTPWLIWHTAWLINSLLYTPLNSHDITVHVHFSSSPSYKIVSFHSPYMSVLVSVHWLNQLYTTRVVATGHQNLTSKTNCQLKNKYHPEILHLQNLFRSEKIMATK